MTSHAFSRGRRRLPALALALLAACGGGGGTASNGNGNGGGNGGGDAPPALTLSASGSSDRSASLAWTPVPGASGYTVQRKAAGADWTEVAALGPADLSYLDDGLAKATTYTYRLAARGTDVPPAERSATTTAEAPLVTPVATPLGDAQAGGSLPAGGGSVVAADGGVRITAPAGAVAGTAAVTLQRTSNPLPGALGDGLRVVIAGRTAKPLTLALRYDAGQDALADGMGVALQRADGSWLALPVHALDRAARTLTVSIAPALLAPGAAARGATLAATAAADETGFVVVRYLNLYLSPREASIETGATQLLVPYAHAEGLPCWADPDLGCLPGLVLQGRELAFDNVKAGYTRSWYVFADEGGTPALGTVTPRAGTGAVYKAPARAPQPNPVTVSFVSRHDKSGRTVTLASRILVKEPVWTMILRGELDGAVDIGFAFSAQAVWTREAGEPEVYRASGTQSVHVINIVCTASATPDTIALPPGALTIDRSVQPARYRLDVGSFWPTVLSGSCPDGSVGNVPLTVLGQLVVEGTLGADGKTIQGSAMQNHVRWEWSMTSGL